MIKLTVLWKGLVNLLGLRKMLSEWNLHIEVANTKLLTLKQKIENTQ